MSETDGEEEGFELESATESSVRCPYCGEIVEVTLDPGGGSVQQYVEDCEVCCQPWNVSVRFEPDGSAKVSVFAQNE